MKASDPRNATAIRDHFIRCVMIGVEGMAALDSQMVIDAKGGASKIDGLIYQLEDMTLKLHNGDAYRCMKSISMRH